MHDMMIRHASDRSLIARGGRRDILMIYRDTVRTVTDKQYLCKYTSKICYLSRDGSAPRLIPSDAPVAGGNPFSLFDTADDVAEDFIAAMLNMRDKDTS